jgi:hypothetical protein
LDPHFSTDILGETAQGPEVSVHYEILHVAQAASKSHPNIGNGFGAGTLRISLCSPRDNGPAFRTRD